jgi:tripartite-type tricarboxylate transporter receptor subunit TctC
MSRSSTWIVVAALYAASAVWAYPVRPIRIIHPFAPGGGTEIQARALAQYLGDSSGQPVVIDSRPGAGSALGTQIAARSAPDGYTLLFTNGAFSASSALSKHPLFDPNRDFAPIVHVGSGPLILVAHPSLGPTFSEWLDHAKANPGKLNFGSAGKGAASHLAMEYLMSRSGINLVHVPFRGSAPAAAALLSGDIHAAMFSASSVLPHIQAGRIRALGVTTVRRSDLLPAVPAIAEMGLPGYEVLQWSGVLAPVRTPKHIVLWINRKINDALRVPQVKKQLANIAVEPVGGTSREFAAFLQAEISKWRKVIKDARIEPE